MLNRLTRGAKDANLIHVDEFLILNTVKYYNTIAFDVRQNTPAELANVLSNLDHSLRLTDDVGHHSHFISEYHTGFQES